jgi:hypothetical protein
MGNVRQALMFTVDGEDFSVSPETVKGFFMECMKN